MSQMGSIHASAQQCVEHIRLRGKVAAVLALATGLAAASAVSAATVYDVNAAYTANELGASTETSSSFGPFTVGYGNTLSGLSNDSNATSAFTAFSAAQFNSAFAGNGNTQGFNFRNNFSIPAVLVDDSASGAGFSGLTPGEILLHPGGLDGQGNAAPIQDAVIQFVAPQAGMYTIAGDFRALANGTRDDEIGVNGVAVYENTTASTSGTAFSLTETLNVGDTITFAVSQGSGGINSNSTGLTATLSVPEPASTALLTLAAAGLLPRRRNR